jgi:hypothetical protein
LIGVRTLLAAVLLFAVVVASGCGGSDAEVQPARDRSAEISALQKKVTELEQGIADQEAARTEAAAKKADAAGIEGAPGINALLFQLPGQAGLVLGAPGGAGPSLTGGELTTGSAWSTIKVPIAERVLADFGGPGSISGAQSEQIRQAITVSDNDAAAALFADLEAEHGGLNGASKAVGQMLRQAGDTETVISTQGRDGFSTYGQTEWSLVEQNRYMAALAGGCISDSASRAFLLGQMAEVTAEPWGLGAAGVPAKWKGGWGPGTDGRYLVRQMGVVEVGGKEVVVTMAAVADDGTFETAQQMLSRIAKWTASRLVDQVGPPTGCG